MYRVRFRRDHRWVPRRASAYLDDELASRPQARFERHVDACPECSALLESLRRMLGLLAATEPPSPKSSALEIAAAVGARLRERPIR